MTTPSGRLADSLRRAHLGALAGELVVIVAGVLLALVIDGWAQDRQDRDTEVTYLQFLERDLQQTVDRLQDLKTFENSQMKDGLFIYRSLSDGVAEADRMAVSLALARLGTRLTTRLASATYVDLINTGNLQLIDNRELRDAIVRFFENAERDLAVIEKNNGFFVDEMYNKLALGSGSVLPRPGFHQGVRTLVAADSMMREAIADGYAMEPDPIWSLPRDDPEWRAVRGQVLMRMRVSAVVETKAEALIDEAAALQAATSAELERHGH
ncbi:MAG: hypothetical protein PVH00_00240 [Gemmatimonadota bacterium]|jgi:hypothetical protein